mgnify:CR=1 FL=1
MQIESLQMVWEEFNEGSGSGIFQGGIDRTNADRMLKFIEEERVESERVEGPYVDVILKNPSEPEYILRLPSRIKVRTSDLNHEIYLNNASY